MATEEDRRRLWREFTLASGIHHPNVIKVLDYTRDETYGDHFVMQYYEGAHDLRQHLSIGVPRPEHGLRLLLDAARGVAAAHASQIAHRDVKPANFLVVPERGVYRLVLIDFGIGESFAASEHFDPITQHGQQSPMTPPYAAPEQWRGGASGPGPDLFSLGMLAFEILTGSPPFSQNQIRDGRLHAVHPRHPLPNSTPVQVRRVIEALVSPDPTARPAADALAEALETFGRERQDSPWAAQAIPTGESTIVLPVRKKVAGAFAGFWKMVTAVAVIFTIAGISLSSILTDRDVILVPGKRLTQLLSSLTPNDQCVELPRLEHDVTGEFTENILAPAVTKAAKTRAKIPLRSVEAVEQHMTTPACRVRVRGTLYSVGYEARAPIVELSMSRFDATAGTWTTVETVRMADGDGPMFPLLYRPLSFDSLGHYRSRTVRRVTGDTDLTHKCGEMSRNSLAESAVRNALQKLEAVDGGRARIRILRQTITEIGASDFAADLAVALDPDGIALDDLLVCGTR